jgi:hypothetical protein
MNYYGTDIDVRLGDRVIYRHFFFGKSTGVVAYLPGASELNPRIEFNGGQQWVVRLENGKGVFMVYFPDLEYAHRRILFIDRAGGGYRIKATDLV